MAAWGVGLWGVGPWGGGGGFGALTLESVVAYRENVLRLTFSEPIFYSRLLEPADASAASHYNVDAVAVSTGLDGMPAREVAVTQTQQPNSAFEGTDVALDGRIVDLFLDRPMSPFPCLYTVTVTDIFSEDLSTSIPTASAQVLAVYRQLQTPVLDTAKPSRDIANPQTLAGALASGSPDPTGVLATFVIDGTGDYGFDEGTENLRKRVLRRTVTRKGGFAHLPNYGAGVPYYGKQLGRQSTLTSMIADIEGQLSQEPDIAKAKVKPVLPISTPGLVRLRILVVPKQGSAFAVNATYNTTAGA